MYKYPAVFLKKVRKKENRKERNGNVFTPLYTYDNQRERERERFGRIGNSINKQVKAFEKNNLMVA